MKTLSLLITLLSYNVLATQDCTHSKNSFKCVKYVRNYDADTITFNIPDVHPLIGNRINIRVLGVDTPEIRTKNKCEKEKAVLAKKEVQTILEKAKRIDLLNIKRGKYFRVVADVVIDGKSLTKYLLKNGHAYSYYGKTKKNQNWCKKNRDIASENKF